METSEPMFLSPLIFSVPPSYFHAFVPLFSIFLFDAQLYYSQNIFSRFYMFYHFIYSMWGSGIRQMRTGIQAFLLKKTVQIWTDPFLIYSSFYPFINLFWQSLSNDNYRMTVVDKTDLRSLFLKFMVHCGRHALVK